MTRALNLLTFDEIAALHYGDRLAFDEELRNTVYRYAAHGFVDEQLVDALKRAKAGAAPPHLTSLRQSSLALVNSRRRGAQRMENPWIQPRGQNIAASAGQVSHTGRPRVSPRSDERSAFWRARATRRLNPGIST